MSHCHSEIPILDEEGWASEFEVQGSTQDSFSSTNDKKSARPRIYLPSDETEITESATSLMKIIAPKEVLFTRSDALIELGIDDDGRAVLKNISPDSFRSLSERHAEIWVKTRDGRSGGMLIEKPRRMSTENAKAIMACEVATDQLPRIKTITSFPPIKRDGHIQTKGFDPETGILVTDHISVDIPSPNEAVRLLTGLLCDFQFASPADQSRAITSILAPMMRLGVWASERVAFPIFLIEADRSQTGKGMLMQLIAGIYGEMPAMVSQPVGGVGSFDESFSSALLKGRPIIQLDNLRGRLVSQILEVFVTAKGLVHARALRQEGEVDSRRYVLFATSNGLESNEDTANRMCVIRLRKRPREYRWHYWREGSLLRHVEANRAKYLGAICSVLREWMEHGEPRIDCHHDQREWAGASNWIVQHIFKLPPLMDGHDEVKERVSTPGLGFLREIALRITDLNVTYTATELAEKAQEEGIPIPGWNEKNQDPDALKKHIGILLAKCFRESNTVLVDGTTVQRTERAEARTDGKGNYMKRTYSFTHAGQSVTGESENAGIPPVGITAPQLVQQAPLSPHEKCADFYTDCTP